MARRNKQWLLVRRPQGLVEPADFRLVEVEVAPLAEGQVLVENHYLSLDPYMRGRMVEGRSYAPPQPLGEVMVGGTVGAVVESRNARFRPGDAVVGMGGWQELHLSSGADLAPVDARALPESLFFGVLGMPGVTAWYGLHRIGRPRAGETVVVSAATGAVGSVVGQLAKLAGCRAVGIAGGPAKCEHAVKELGYDACVDYKADGYPAAFERATPAGVDVLFENVGGRILDGSLARMNPFGRVALCGVISAFSGQDPAVRNVAAILVNRLTVQGFIVVDHLDLFPVALSELGPLVAAGKLRHHETIAQGLESAPRAFIGMLRGENLGKQLVKLLP